MSVCGVAPAFHVVPAHRVDPANSLILRQNSAGSEIRKL
ncbi:hypothetical protein BV133_2048 [Blastochloris viridis]|uniref:Uncharacterized protein n=1 Tax=Blastochloris viridis TaxID=1079 RepID=A0A182D405_BLAVI|nr:hypothetical protein BV133_2048 [Blastochloris viridis]